MSACRCSYTHNFSGQTTICRATEEEVAGGTGLAWEGSTLHEPTKNEEVEEEALEFGGKEDKKSLSSGATPRGAPL